MDKLHAILLAGGSGSRFWPASRRARPKQFLRIVGDRPMLAETYLRLDGLVGPERTWVVTTREHAGEVADALPELPASQVLIEPCARNTAAAIAMAALHIERVEKDALQVVLPADHVIRPRSAFQATLRAACIAARQADDSLFVFGIHPSYPATEFGWIKTAGVEGIVDFTAVHTVERFVEKPDLARAKEFLESGGYYWNSGMFLWSTQAISKALEQHAPQLRAALSAHMDASAGASGAAFEQAYAALPPVSIDVAVFERAKNVCMLPIDYFWSDVGAWDALAGVNRADEQGHVAAGGTQLAALDSRGCIVYGEAGGLVALLGVEDLIVVRSGSVTLVCRRDRAQDVKKLVERLAAERSEHL
jgi:mannose-1-phosphate guanylyltransferase